MINNEQIEYLATRENPLLQSRRHQMTLNELAYNGGFPYINKRLTQFPNETSLDFFGGSRYDGVAVQGRKNYTPAPNYLRDIADTLDYLTFYNPPIRTGAPDNLVINNVNGRDKDINYLMKQINHYITLFGWAWIKVDFPTRIPQGLSIAEKEALDIRPFFYAIKPQNVVDWQIGKKSIEWLIEEDEDLICRTPYSAAVTQKVRRLWEPGKVTITRFLEPNDKRRKTEYQTEVLETGIDEVPFVLVGEPSCSPISFDAMELIQKNILNLESMNIQVFLDSAFPREFITASQYERLYNEALSHCTLSKDGQQIYDERAAMQMAFRMATGTKYPLVLGQGESPFTPSMPTGLDQIRTEISENIHQLREVSGLNIKKDSKMIESAEAKIFDFISVEAQIKNRRSQLQNAENFAVYLAKVLDNDFNEWQVTYPDEILISISENTEE